MGSKKSPVARSVLHYIGSGDYGKLQPMFQVRILLLLTFLWRWQSAEPVIIDSSNLDQLQSVIQLDFTSVAALGLNVGSGIFVMNADATLLVSFAHEAGHPPMSTAVIWDGESGELRDTFPIGENSYARALSSDGGRLAVATMDGVRAFDLESGAGEAVIETTSGPILAVWFDSEGVICAETAPPIDSPAQILCEDGRLPVPIFGGDSLDFVRIGRVPPPLAVTGSESGRMRRWNLASGTITAEAEAGDVAIFGAVNVAGWPDSPQSATHLAWRNPDSAALNLLDFQSGDNRLIVDLDGEFMAYLLLSRGADVIFGIDPLSARGSLWAWDVGTQNKVDLGEYRACSRQPDLASLSYDGTALVIGCETGVDIWRVQGEE